MTVYLIRAGENGPVKIGFADDVKLRLVKMQADNHERLTVLRIFEGAQAQEAALHLRFADLRLHGEWFSFSRAMLGELGLAEILSGAEEAEEHAPLPPNSAAAVPDAREIVRTGGGASKLARALGLHHTTVLGWHRVPAERVISVERLTGISRHLIRPDIYPAEAPDKDDAA